MGVLASFVFVFYLPLGYLRYLLLRLITPTVEFFIGISGTVESVLEITGTVELYCASKYQTIFPIRQ